MSCSTKCINPNELSPKDIRGYTFEFRYKEVNISNNPKNDDSAYLNNVSHYSFNTNDTYTSKINGKLIASGNFSYKQINSYQGKLIISYSNSNGEQTYTAFLTFKDKESGSWKGSFGRGQNTIENGTFKIINNEEYEKY